MSVFVNSLRRLYKAGRRSIEDITALLNAGKITQADFDYITE